jgi:hypothetical protein
MYLQFPAAHKDTLLRDDATFRSEVWPSLENLRKSSRVITSSDMVEFGRTFKQWKLKGM